MPVQKAQYGTWSSPLSPDRVAEGMKFSDVQWDTDGTTVVWSERRQEGRRLVMQRGADALRDLTDASTPVGGRIGYGGGDFTVAHGVAYFVSGGHVHRVSLNGGLPRALTPDFGGAASPVVSADGEWVAFVHTYRGLDGIALVDAAGESFPVKLAYGDDFVMQPTWHPSGQYLAYVAWNHPDMPWINTELRLIKLEYDGRGMPRPQSNQTIAGGAGESIFQPLFSPDGRYLAYVSDADGYWHLYLYDMETKTHRQLTTGPAEHGIPAWIQGMRTYGWTGDSSALYYLRNQDAVVRVWTYDLAHAAALPVHELTAYTHFEQIAVSPAGEQIAAIASAPTVPARIITYEAETGTRILRRATAENLPAEVLSDAQPIQWIGHDGETVHGLFSPPTNPAYEGIGLPPLIVRVHGGPTSQRYASYDAEVQLFTSRGYAVLQVNHRGSTGYGRAYMEKHHTAWGVYDVEDSAAGAAALAREGRVDEGRIVIMGTSAGGYTVLKSLIDKPGFYAAGVCAYAVADLFAISRDTHKFEERYNDWLIGPLPEAAALYHARSPVFHAERIQDPVIVFQGGRDNVVPPNQAEAVVDVLRRTGAPHEYHVYPEAGHGWRQPETVADYYEKILDFLERCVLYTSR